MYRCLDAITYFLLIQIGMFEHITMLRLYVNKPVPSSTQQSAHQGQTGSLIHACHAQVNAEAL